MKTPKRREGLFEECRIAVMYQSIHRSSISSLAEQTKLARLRLYVKNLANTSTCQNPATRKKFHAMVEDTASTDEAQDEADTSGPY